MHGYVLVKDGNDTFCPFQQPIPTQTNMGSMALMRLPCSSNCPLAKYNGSDKYTIHCGGEVKTFDITEEEKGLNGSIIL